MVQIDEANIEQELQAMHLIEHEWAAAAFTMHWSCIRCLALRGRQLDQATLEAGAAD